MRPFNLDIEAVRLRLCSTETPLYHFDEPDARPAAAKQSKEALLSIEFVEAGTDQPVPAQAVVPARKVVVTTLGTCRIAEPVAAATKRHAICRNVTDVYGFVHTTKEILQLLDFFEGRVIPEELVRFVASADYAPHRPRGATDLFFVEVSSQKEIHFNGWLLQINCMDRVFESRRELFETFFRHKYAADREQRAQALAALPSFAAADPTERRILLEGHVHMTTREELDQDLQIITARLSCPAVFVSHIDVADGTGRPIQSRSRLCGWMREICAERGHVFFDPTPQVVAYDRVRALADEGRDNNHYTSEFKSVLGSLLFETFAEPLLLTDRLPSAPLPSPASAPPTVSLPTILPSSGVATPGPVLPGRIAADSLHPPVLREVLADAKGRIGRGEMDEAEVLLRGAAIDYPGVAEIYALMASVAYHRGDSTAALADLRHALRIDPAMVEPKVMLVRIAQRLNRLEEACTQATELINCAANDHKALTVAAKALVKAKRFHEASPVWRRIAVLRPDQASPLAEAARCELKGRNYDAAAITADEALRRDPEDAAALVIKAEALQRAKRMPEMAAVALRIAAIDPGAAMAMVPALVASTHHEEAATVIAAVRGHGHAAAEDQVMQAGLVRTLTKRARLATERNDAGAAATSWKAVLLLDPTSRNAASGMRKLVSPLMAELRGHLGAGDVGAAVASCQRGLALDPGNVRLLRELAVLQEKALDWPGAASSWEEVAAAGGPAPQCLLRAGRAAGRAGRPDEALRIYNGLDPALLAEMRSTLQSLIRKLVRAMRDDFAAGAMEQAVVKARIVQAADPEIDAVPRLLRKVVSVLRKRLKQAVALEDVAQQEDVARRILDIDPNRTDALKILVRVLRNAKRWRDSIELQQRLVRMEPHNAGHWRRLASACRSARVYDVGVNAALKAVELEPGNTRSMDFLSDILNRQALAA